MKRKLVLLFIGIHFLLGAYTLEELEHWKNKKLISIVDYNILKNELLKIDKFEYYTLKVNYKKVTNRFPVLKSKDNNYFPLDDFFKLINFGNMNENKNEFTIYLGKDSTEIKIDKLNNKIFKNKIEINFDKNSEIYLIKDNKIYLKNDIFKQLFLNYMNKNDETATINFDTNFLTPSQINSLLDRSQQRLSVQNGDKELLFKSQHALFDLGYVRITADKNFTKNSGEKSYKGDWASSLEYQGGALYGQLSFNYDVKENILEDVKLDYTNIWKGHTLKLENRNVDTRSREWGLSFYKDKSYYINDKKAVIRESVPLGSRVELKYMGTTIAIKDEKNGVVVFDDPIIVMDRSYEIYIYTPDGKITKKIITTVNDYNKQNKNEVEYTFLFNEIHSAKKIRKEAQIFYGFTDSLTLGFGYNQDAEQIENSYRYINDTTTSIVYGDNYNGLSYILSLNLDKSLDDYNIDGKSYKDKYSYNIDIQANYKKFKFNINNAKYGVFYSEKLKQTYEIQYDFTDNLRGTYEYGISKNYDGTKENTSRAGFTYDKTYKKFLFSVGADMDANDKESYNVSIYHTGSTGINTKLENRWVESLSDWETNISIYNNSYLGMVDYSLDFGYSEKYKDKITFSFTISYDNWFRMDSSFDKEGTQTHSIGLDRIVDLKNPLQDIDSIDVSRVKITTYIDNNNNNNFDNNESVIEDVEVTIGKKTKKTDKNGQTIFYNISNGVIYDLKPTIKKPNYTLGGNTIKIKSDYSSTVDVFIPIKPMLNLNGVINIDKKLNLTKIQKEDIYNNILVSIKDLNGKEIELAMPDNMGIFDVSGLFPKEYIIEIDYIGKKYNIPKLKEIIKMKYTENNCNNLVEFDFSKSNIKVQK